MKFLKKVEKQMKNELGLVISEPTMVEQQDFGFGEKAINHQKYLEYSKRKPKTIVYSFSASVHLCKLSEHYILFDDERELILYFVHFKNKMILKHKLTIQVLLWAEPGLDYKISGDTVPTYVFFEKLLKEGEGVGIATDAMQTLLGKRFWYGRVSKAFNRGMYVYIVDQNTHKVVEVKDYMDFKDKAKEFATWTDEKVGMARRVVISEKKLW